ncbi:MAG: chemotaxis protein CheD [Acetobacteraceae bacterium]|nr:chemotaxis protein CheD [Acetobacteraceae bacterium]
MNALSDDAADPLEPPLRVFLNPGGVHCAAAPTVISTILGSCVAVCLWDRALRVGGMNHYLLAHDTRRANNTRFGDVAVERLVEGMLRLGCRPDTMRAKVFGGAAVLQFGANGDTVGSQNVRLALQLMHTRGIPVIARRTGGRFGLMIRLHTDTGDVLVRRLSAGPAPTPDPPQIWPPRVRAIPVEELSESAGC